MKKLLHIGCGNLRHKGFINTDKEMDITKPWPHKDNSVDGIVSMQVFQQIEWRGLIKALKEAYRVLKPGGVMRFGTMLIDDNDVDYALGWNNINLFNFSLLKNVLTQIGFKDIRMCYYLETLIEEFKRVDNRPLGKGTSYCECVK